MDRSTVQDYLLPSQLTAGELPLFPVSAIRSKWARGTHTRPQGRPLTPYKPVPQWQEVDCSERWAAAGRGDLMRNACLLFAFERYFGRIEKNI